MIEKMGKQQRQLLHKDLIKILRSDPVNGNTAEISCREQSRKKVSHRVEPIHSDEEELESVEMRGTQRQMG